MFITCQECNTTYRLDEKMLKPTGSKVRCSQCRHKFVAVPVAATAFAAPIQSHPAKAAPTSEKVKPAVAGMKPEETSLEGINLAELDAILQGDTPSAPFEESEPAHDRGAESSPMDQMVDADDIDLEIDFDAAIGATAAESKGNTGEGSNEFDDIELDMDFEIDDEALPSDEEEDLDLGPAIADAEEAIGTAGIEPSIGEPSIEDDLESVLDGLDLDSDNTATPAEASSGQGTLKDDLELDDLDFELDEAPEAVSAEEELELDLDGDLDLGIEEQPTSLQKVESKVPKAATDDLDLDFDLDLEDIAEEPGAEVEEAELSLDADFNLQLDEAPSKGAPDGKGAMADEEDLDLTGLDTLLGTGDESVTEDLDLSLDADFDLQLDAGPAKDVSDGKGTVANEEDLDLTGLDTLLGTGDESGGEELDLSLDDDLDLKGDLELEMDEGSSKAAEDTGDTSDELDLTGLDTLMDSGEEEGAGIAAELEEPDLELDDLGLELDSGQSESPKITASVDADEELEDLDFHLDDEFEEKPAVQGKQEETTEVPLEDEEEIDLSDIEQMLGGDEKPVAPKAPAQVPEQDLGFGGGGEIDLAELESAIDEAEMTDIDEPDVHEEQELALDAKYDKSKTKKEEPVDLSLGLEEKPSADKEEEELELELELESEGLPSNNGDTIDLGAEELDLSDLGDIVEEVNASEKRETAVSTGDIELEFQIEEDEAQAPSASATRTTAGMMKPAAPATIQQSLEQSMDTLALEESFSPQPKPFKPKKKSSKALAFFIFLLIIALIGGGLWYAVTQMGIEIPYVSNYLNEYFNPKPKDPAGVLRLSTLDINSKFVENSQAGRLFVITGKVRNGYSTPRSNVRMQGRLYTKGKVISKTEYSYAGTLLSDQDLASLPIAEIKQRLNAPAQPQEATGIVRSGQNLAFMLVFSDLPPMEELDEFAVEPVNSAPGQ